MLNQIKEFIKGIVRSFRQNRKILSLFAGIFYTVFRYLFYQAEYYKAGWEQEKVMHRVDNIRCQEALSAWKSQDSIRDQQLWNEAFSRARERIIQPAIDSISKL